MNQFLISLLNILNEMSPYILFGFLIAGILHAFVSPEGMSHHLSGHGWKPVIKAALFGIPLPLCSCGVLPTAVALRNQGASKGATTSFLIATPQTGVDSIAATYALLGLPFAIMRPLGALTGALFGGLAVNSSDRRPSASETASSPTQAPSASLPPTFRAKVVDALRYGFLDMVGSVGKWLVIGLIVAALITMFMPENLLLSLSRYPILAMLLMVAIAVPMYICATGSIPIALSLMLKGLSPGAAFVLLMAGPAANFASVLVLKRSLGTRSTTIYIGSVIVTALLFGLVIDHLLPATWFMPQSALTAAHACHVSLPLFPTLCSLLLVTLLIISAIRNHRPRALRSDNSSIPSNATDNSDINPITPTLNPITDMETIYNVKGMACNHCKTTVEKTLLSLPGVETVTVDLTTGRVKVTGTAAPSAVAEAITAAGFTCPLPS